MDKKIAIKFFRFKQKREFKKKNVKKFGTFIKIGTFRIQD